MKLRIQGNSIRLRLVRPELARLIDGEVLQENVHLSPSPNGVLSYRLSSREQAQPVAIKFADSAIDVVISLNQLTTWKQETEVGIYTQVDTGFTQPLQISIEKDFACLDRSDAENKDTFPHPLEGSVC